MWFQDWLTGWLVDTAVFDGWDGGPDGPRSPVKTCSHARSSKRKFRLQAGMDVAIDVPGDSNVSAKWPECDFFLACPLYDYIDLFWFKYPRKEPVGGSNSAGTERSILEVLVAAFSILIHSILLHKIATQKKWNMEYSS